MKKISSIVLLALCAFIIGVWCSRVDADSSAANLPKIYDESADGTKQIRDAIAVTQKDGRHILMQFGANWCPWCHKLRSMYDSHKEIADMLKSNYVLVMIDVDKDHNKDFEMKYGHPRRFGIPVLMVLDATGKPLTTEKTDELVQGDHFDAEKLEAFLKEWAPKKRV